jgi:ribonuclease P protein subunit RPR2
VRPRKTSKGAAREAAESLMRNAVSNAGTDLDTARRQADMARAVMLRHNVRLGYPLKRFVCHGCKKLVVPGVNARVRVGRGKPPVLRITCLGCGRVNRKILKQP